LDDFPQNFGQISKKSDIFLCNTLKNIAENYIKKYKEITKNKILTFLNTIVFFIKNDEKIGKL